MLSLRFAKTPHCSFRSGLAGAFGLSFLLLVGCGKSQETVKGVAPTPAAFITARDVAKTPGQTVTLHGEMIEKCPVAGCWFILRDKTGTVRVDTKAAGFVVTDVPLHTQMTVSGKALAGAQSGLAATGIRY